MVCLPKPASQDLYNILIQLFQTIEIVLDPLTVFERPRSRSEFREQPCKSKDCCETAAQYDCGYHLWE